MKLFKGHAIVEGRKSEYSLYDEKLATYTKDDAFDHHAAIGFIELWGLPTKVNSIVKKKEQINAELVDPFFRCFLKTASPKLLHALICSFFFTMLFTFVV